MHLITLTLLDSEVRGVDPERITEILRASAEPADRIEHLRTLGGPDRYELAVFLLADTASQARTTARQFCERAIATDPALRNHRLAP
ncbi:hypothetical protein AB0M43_24380 [Longispora sp. NPDC051575]|uniref:hypothetical protein n=1 Tax=Longispora sp. NPDC051575 TaxID=3154943 RepID=UPI003426E987